MSKQAQIYTPHEFLEKLNRDDLRLPFAFIGMVKQADNDKHVLFSIGRSCTNWITVSVDFIEKIEHLDTVACEDHTHHLVKMYFKTPKSEEGLLLASLAVEMRNESQRAVMKIVKQCSSVRDDACVECWRRCSVTVQSPEDFFDCLNRCAPLCPG
jgi:hypothetical protein